MDIQQVKLSDEETVKRGADVERKPYGEASASRIGEYCFNCGELVRQVERHQDMLGRWVCLPRMVDLPPSSSPPVCGKLYWIKPNRSCEWPYSHVGYCGPRPRFPAFYVWPGRPMEEPHPCGKPLYSYAGYRCSWPEKHIGDCGHHLAFPYFTQKVIEPQTWCGYVALAYEHSWAEGCLDAECNQASQRFGLRNVPLNFTWLTEWPSDADIEEPWGERISAFLSYLDENAGRSVEFGRTTKLASDIRAMWDLLSEKRERIRVLEAENERLLRDNRRLRGDVQ